MAKNINGQIQVQQGDTLFGIYGPNWKQDSGFQGDPRRLQVGSMLPGPKQSSTSQVRQSQPTTASRNYSPAQPTNFTPELPSQIKTQKEFISKETAGQQPKKMTQSMSVNYPQNNLQIPEFTPDQQRNADLIREALEEEGINTPRVLAYALATAKHESGLSPKDEYQADPRTQPDLYRLQQNYGGGWRYHGRGLIQLTHESNYRAMGERIGMGDELVRNPELANDPRVAAKIMAAFFKDRGVSDLANSGDFIGARRPVNGVDRADAIAVAAQRYLDTLSGTSTPTFEPVQAVAPTQDQYMNQNPNIEIPRLNDLTPENLPAYLQSNPALVMR